MNENDMETLSIPGTGNFQFSAIGIENLEASEYTLVTVVIDISQSVEDFKNELLNCLKSIVEACQDEKNPRAENLLIRVLIFNTVLEEIHGFKNATAIDVNDYKEFTPRGMTALYDATYSAVGATITYGKRLIDQDYTANGAVYIITDGCDNQSSMRPHHIAEKLDEIKRNEQLESIITILIGLQDEGKQGGWSDDVKEYLETFKNEAGLTEFINAGDANKKTIMKIANWIVSSISSQSQAIGSGGPSQLITF